MNFIEKQHFLSFCSCPICTRRFYIYDIDEFFAIELQFAQKLHIVSAIAHCDRQIWAAVSFRGSAQTNSEPLNQTLCGNDTVVFE